MKNKITKSAFKFISLLLFAVILGVTACTEDPEETLYRDDLIGPDYPAPVIESVNPPDAALAGVTVVTIQGQNFSPNVGYNLVFFDSELGDIISATGNEIVVRAPAYVDTSVDLKIAVRKVEDFSNVYKYRLEPAVADYTFKTSSVIYNLAVSQQDEVYINGSAKKFYKVIFPSLLEEYSLSNLSGPLPDMTFGPGNQLFYLLNATSGNSAIFYLPSGGGERERVPASGIRNSTSLDFDSQQNIWVSSSSENTIFKVDYPSGEVTEYPFEYSISWLKVFEGYLYVAASNENEAGIWRFPIDNGILGTEEKYFDFSGNFPDTDVTSFVISENGEIYAATTNDEILIIYPDGSTEVLYPDLIKKPILSALVYGEGTSFYYISETPDATGNLINSIVRVDVEKQGAPYYGRQ